ncbi:MULTISPECIES: hypothetical protein [Mycobacterium]|nr:MULTISPECIES: hypothetical protein [Mycobacterium]MDA3641980.1 hypothetical protein [Mycobacterium xenopi]MDA3659867.1 hypothetical protein [Mycobacterium xenopi]MDA3664412.1 hypothetical protein [Mycobacterium xenopi]SPX88540.1 Uncharacterised protein [Mycobacterium xenopi]
MAQTGPEQPPEQPVGEGFRAAMDALTERRYREMRGAWARAPERLRRAEAARRARNEMARRVAQHTGRPRVSARTIARRARHDAMPPGVERMWLERWAAIDRAGGIRAMARQVGTTPQRVTSWRDSPRPEAPLPTPPPPERLPVEAQTVGVETQGVVIINGKAYPKRIPEGSGAEQAELEIQPDSGIMEAWLAEDTETLYELLSDQIVMQIIVPRWNLPPTYSIDYQIEELRKFVPGL